jgi:hypothetical protein
VTPSGCGSSASTTTRRRCGLWTLLSKDGYPADATQQMAEAATSLMDRKILEVTSMVATDHVPFGVVDPLGPNLEVGQKGVGTRGQRGQGFAGQAFRAQAGAGHRVRGRGRSVASLHKVRRLD